MTEQKRPRQVTVAGWVIVLGSLAAVVTAYDQITRLNSVDMRESVRKMLDDPPFDGLGLGVHTVLDVMHVLALVTAACATAAVVLGWHVLRRHRHSRIALTVVAVPLLVAGVGSGGLFSTLVAVAVLLLWLPPAGEWFQADTVAEAPARPHPPRPAGVTLAALLTWAFSALAAVFTVAGTIVVTADPGHALRQAVAKDPAFADQGVTPGMLVASAWFLAVMVMAYGVAASVAAVLAWRRVASARTTLVVLLAIATAFLLIASLLIPALVVAFVGAVVALALLVRRDARAWFEQRER